MKKMKFNLQKREQITLLIVLTALISFWYYSSLNKYLTEIVYINLTYGQTYDPQKVRITDKSNPRFEKVKIIMDVYSNTDQDKIEISITGSTDNSTQKSINPYFLFNNRTYIKKETSAEDIPLTLLEPCHIDPCDTLIMKTVGNECFSLQKNMFRKFFIRNKTNDKTSSICITLDPSDALIDTLEWHITCHFPEHYYLSNVSPGPQEKNQCTTFSLERRDTTQLKQKTSTMNFSMQTTDNLTKGRNQVWTFLISVIIAACTSILVSFYINPPDKKKSNRKRTSRTKLNRKTITHETMPEEPETVSQRKASATTPASSPTENEAQ